MGCLMVYTVVIGDEPVTDYNYFFLNTAAGKQIIWAGISLLVFTAVQLIDWKFWQTFAYPIYGFAILLLILVLFFGAEVKGAKSWFRFGSVGFQPSEIAKFATCLVLSSYLSDFKIDIKKTRHLLIAVCLLAAPVLLILQQPDAGSALVFLSFATLFYREGFSPSALIVGFGLVALLLISLASENTIFLTLILISTASLLLFAQFTTKFYWLLTGIPISGVSIYFILNSDNWQFILLVNSIILGVLSVTHYINKKKRIVNFILIFLFLALGLSYSTNYIFNNFLQAHQQERINMWLNPEKCDPSGPLYNLIQSQTAIAAGGLQGRGLFQGTMTKLDYVPEQLTDFIFCAVGEEHGFIGVVILIGLFLSLLIRIVQVAERQRSSFSKNYAYGIAGIVFIHVFVNLGMTMGLMPIIGIPLPFISNGGSSLLGFTIMMAVLVKLDTHRLSL